ncbi:MAG: hypothetical protein AAFQ14_13930 [Cyanobacteria bacterium J06621_12]
MPLRNPRSIVGQAILLNNFFSNLLLMISRYYWFIGIVFLTAIVSVSMNWAFYLPLALGLIAIALISSPRWSIQGGFKKTIVVIGLVVFCLIVPQVETNTAIFASPIEDLQNHLYSS